MATVTMQLLTLITALHWGYAFLRCMEHCAEDIPSFRRMISHDQGQHPVMKIRTWLYSDAPNTMVKWATKAARGQDQHLKYACALARANEMADSWSSSFDANSAALRRGFDKTHIFVHTFAVLRRFIVLGWFATVWKTQTGHTHTHSKLL